MRTIMITGATRGLGLALTRALDGVEDVELVLAVRDEAAGRAVAASLRRPAQVLALDTGKLAAVRRIAAGWSRPLYALVHNAGLQLTGPTERTDEGIETTLAVNHLGPLALTLGLMPWLSGGRVVGIGSGTHNPDNRTATVFGFRGGRFSSIAALARGDSDARSQRQAGMDRYATSKLLAMVAAMELAQRYPRVSFATFDPGMMPGTGLARSGPWYARLVWHTLLRWLVPWLGDASTPERSAAAARALLLAPEIASGEVYGYDGAPSERVWPRARDPELARRVLDESCAFLAQHPVQEVALPALTADSTLSARQS